MENFNKNGGIMQGNKMEKDSTSDQATPMIKRLMAAK